MIAIVDYNAGNLTSVKRALDYLNIESVITPSPETIAGADRVIFPGVGNAASAMHTLRERELDAAVRRAFEAGAPILGICLGAQVILSRSEEGDTECLGLMEGVCRRFQLEDRSLKIPHMGWNNINLVRSHPVLRGVRDGDELYFVHSYYPCPASDEHVLAVAEHGVRFASAIGDRNLIAAQFHPEKSGELGLHILKNFAQWDGAPC